MRVRLGLKKLGQAAPTLRRVHGFQAGREWPGSGTATQAESLRALEEGLDGAAESRPELDLSRNGAVLRLAGQPGIQDERIREFNRVTHIQVVA